MKNLIFTDKVQNTFSPAGYYRNPESLEIYKHKSHFLARLNNEIGSELSEKNKEGMISLHGLMMVMFDNDQIIFPKESEIFGELTARDKDGKRVLHKMEETEIYKNDNLGLKSLNE
jgi:palmitoyl-protein thioesterase